jgi:quercetin dioxygenase-like cupin family protein
MSDIRVVQPHQAEPKRAGSSQMFTGSTDVREISTALGMPYIEVNLLTVQADARSRPHRHDVEQILYFLEGPGLVAIDGGEDQIVEEGAFVLIPPGAVHMHGAPAGNSAAYVSFIAMEHESDFSCPIPEAWSAYGGG